MAPPVYGPESLENPRMIAALEGPPAEASSEWTTTLSIGFLEPDTAYWWLAEMRGGINSTVVERSTTYQARTAGA